MKKSLLCIFILFMSNTGFPEIQNEKLSLEKIAGVYKVRFQNGLMSGERFISENILEIVPVNEHAAYIRMELEFFNGHKGAISGIAEKKDSKLVYMDKEKSCLVEWNFSKDKITTHADYQKYPECAVYHGARGTLDNIEFPRKNKRVIRYMQRLKNSLEFKEATTEYHSDSK